MAPRRELGSGKQVDAWLCEAATRATPGAKMTQYIDYEAMARLEYGRILWRNPRSRNRLLKHWTDPQHPYALRFQSCFEPLVREVLESSPDPAMDLELDRRLRERGYSLRAVAREIPPVFGSFW